MKEARATGELESSLAATSVMPMPKRPNRKNVPLADFNHAVANMAKPSACVQPSGIQSPGIQAPGIQAVPKSTLLADVPASSSAPPMSQGPMPLPMPQTSVPMQTKQVSTASTNPETSQGINRMRLSHERGDPLPTVEEAKVQRAKAAIFRSNLSQTVDPQVVAKALATPVEAPGLSYPPGPGYRPAGYVKPDPPATLNKKSRVTRQPVQVSLQTAIPEGEEEDDKQMPLTADGAMAGAMTDASKRQRSPGGSMFDDHLAEFDEWEEVDLEYANGDVVYAPVLDPQADAAGISPGPRPPMGSTWQEPANIAERHRRANSHCPEDVMSYGEWGRTMIEFGKEMRGESYYAVAHGAEPRYVQYRKWARTHLERKSVLGKDFIKYLAVKEHYFGTYEDDMHYRAERIAQAKAKAAAKAVAPPKQQRRSTRLHRSQARIVDDSIWMWVNIQALMIHGITICSEGMWRWWHDEFILHAMKLRQSYVQDRCLRLVQCGKMCGGLTMWQMYVIPFAFGQCKHVNSTMTMVQVAIYSTATIFYFCTVFALYFSLVIALHIQLQLKRGCEILVIYL